MTLRYLIIKEFKQFLRNPFMPRLAVMLPVMIMLIFPWAATQDVSNIRLAYVDHDHSPESRQLIEKTMAGGYFIGQANCASYAEALELVQRGEADIILQIAPDFARNLKRPEPSRVMLAANAVNGTKGMLGAAYLQQIIQSYSRDIVVTDGNGTLLPAPALSERYLFNPHLDYKRFMLPALMVMLLIMLTGFLPALNIVTEKERGTIEQINVTPITRGQFILGKLIPYWLIGLLALTLALTIAAWVYDFRPAGSLLTLYLFALVFISVISGFGLLVSNFSNTMQQAMFVMFFFVLVFMLMSGLFTPIASMPDWAQMLAYINPPRYFIEAMRMLFLKGSGIAQLLPQLSILLCFSLAFNTLAMLTYKKSS